MTYRLRNNAFQAYRYNKNADCPQWVFELIMSGKLEAGHSLSIVTAGQTVGRVEQGDWLINFPWGPQGMTASRFAQTFEAIPERTP